jgi:hypothetical protein
LGKKLENQGKKKRKKESIRDGEAEKEERNYFREKEQGLLSK